MGHTRLDKLLNLHQETFRPPVSWVLTRLCLNRPSVVFRCQHLVGLHHQKLPPSWDISYPHSISPTKIVVAHPQYSFQILPRRVTDHHPQCKWKALRCEIWRVRLYIGVHTNWQHVCYLTIFICVSIQSLNDLGNDDIFYHNVQWTSNNLNS